MSVSHVRLEFGESPKFVARSTYLPYRSHVISGSVPLVLTKAINGPVLVMHTHDAIPSDFCDDGCSGNVGALGVPLHHGFAWWDHAPGASAGVSVEG